MSESTDVGLIKAATSPHPLFFNMGLNDKRCMCYLVWVIIIMGACVGEQALTSNAWDVLKWVKKIKIVYFMLGPFLIWILAGCSGFVGALFLCFFFFLGDTVKG